MLELRGETNAALFDPFHEMEGETTMKKASAKMCFCTD